MKNQINIDKNSGHISITDAQGVAVHINTHHADEILQKLDSLETAQLDALQQIAEKQQAHLSDLFRTLLKGVATQKNVVSGTISQVGGDVHVGDNVYNFHFTYLNMTPAPVVAQHQISLSDGQNVSIEILERRYLLDRFQHLVDAGHRYIVLHGSNGIGKTTFASLYYNAYSKGKYMQKGWFNFQGNLPETYVQELTEEELEKPSDITKWKDFYYRQALVEVRKLNNVAHQHPNGKRLIVIDNVDDEAGIAPYYDSLLHVENTVFVFIAQQAFHDERFAHFALPRLTDDEVRNILGNFLSKQSQDAYMEIINGSPFILALMLKQSPREGEKKVQHFADLILKTKQDSIAEKDLQIVEALYRINAPNPLEEWLLLQFAALPNGAYDEVMLNQYWQADGGSEEEPTFEDVLNLASCQTFLGQHTAPDGVDSIQALLERLEAKGWLEDKTAEYEINSLMRSVFVFLQKNQYAYTAEIAECLRINFFTHQHNNLKDHLAYEKHLLHYLDFVESAAHPKYLDTLYKLVQWYQEAGAYYEELKHRQRHFALAQQCYGIESDFLIERETELAWNLKEVGDLQTAKKHGENALDKAYRVLSDKAPLTAKCEGVLGLILQNMGDYATAKVLLEKAVRSNEANFGEMHPKTAPSYSNLASILYALGDHEVAKVLLEKAVRSNEVNLGEIHPTTVVSYSNLALVLRDLGDYATAKVLLEKALCSFEANFGEMHPSTALSYSNLALVLQDLRDYEAAKVLLEKAVCSNEANFGEMHPKTAVSYYNLAMVLSDLKEYDLALALVSKAYRISLELLGQQHPNTKTFEGNLNGILNKMLQNGYTEEEIAALMG